ncbi:MAG: sigma-54-dependent Fis family transcriptional regulator [Armatimonadetes bacterium]|nr:sigma-54-dependent Fis family transcriptional regulator [Armatimonadota bacterium]
MSEKKRILIVDDEQNIRRILQASLDKAGFFALVAESGEQALQMLQAESVECVLTDVAMPGMDGYELQVRISKLWPDIAVVIMTAYGTIPQAVQAIRDGAFEYITKPFDLDVVKRIIKAAVKSQPASSARRPSGSAEVSGRFIAESKEMLGVLELVKQVADSRATVLITGESGTGKEVVARLIHDLSPRLTEPYVAVSCAALPESLLESELFGYMKGAFTGADHDKPGRFELANKGTLFLDEIGEVPLPTQVKLLRVLQERVLERLGSIRPTEIDVRLVSASNVDLRSAVEEGLFRLDLLYRLQVIEVELPPLRDRLDDIYPLAMHFLAKYSAENGRALADVCDKARKAMLEHDWPGNVRELENVIERAVVLANREDTEMLVEHLPKALQSAA